MQIKENLLIHRKKILLLGLSLIFLEKWFDITTAVGIAELSNAVVTLLILGMAMLILMKIPEPEETLPAETTLPTKPVERSLHFDIPPPPINQEPPSPLPDTQIDLSPLQKQDPFEKLKSMRRR